MSQLRKTVLSQLQDLSQQTSLLNERDQPDVTPLHHHTSVLRIAIQNAMVDLTVEFADASHYSMMLYGLHIQTHEPDGRADDITAYLSERAENLIQQLSYLEEPLTLCELDANEHAVQLRSAPPDRDGEQITYWEMMLRVAEKTPSFSMARYAWRPGMAERERLAYPATFVLVGRFAESVCTIFQQ